MHKGELRRKGVRWQIQSTHVTAVFTLFTLAFIGFPYQYHPPFHAYIYSSLLSPTPLSSFYSPMASTSSGSPSSSNSSPSRISKNQSVSQMIRQGYISDPGISSSVYPAPPTFKGIDISPTSTLHPTSSASTSTPAPSSPSRAPNPTSPSTASLTLSQMMTSEKNRQRKSSVELLHDQVSDILSNAPFQHTEAFGAGDVSITIRGKPLPGEGGSSSFKEVMLLHRTILADRSKFFAEKLPGRGFHSIEILDCDDVVAYVEAMVLMYYDEPRTKLIGKDVSNVLTLLKVS